MDDQKANPKLRPLPDLVDDLQSRGRYAFTGAELEAQGGRSDVAVRAALRRLKRQGRIASPRRGFHVVVPLEYRIAGCPPASWFIDDLMRYLEQPYYVGLLSAAALHGAAHQQPMVFQVITDRPTRAASTGRTRIEFHASRRVEDMPVTAVQTETGTMRVATPEVCAFDLVRYSGAAGHLSNVATVLAELAERVRAERLVKLAPLYKLPDAQRLGYLLEQVGASGLAAPLVEWLRRRRYRAVPLRAGWATGEQRADSRWRVIPNVAVEVDL